MSTPYSNLPSRSFWKTAVGNKSLFDISELWSPKWHISPRDKVSTYGSCFAQHIGRALRQRGYHWYIAENSPRNLVDKTAYNYEVFTSRTGNIYTTSLLNQWVKWSTGVSEVPSESWDSNGRVIDPFRPRIEPNGFSSVKEMLDSRSVALKSFKESIAQSNYFVFTLGLTESWLHKDGYEYPMCPGTVAGVYSDEGHEFKNQKMVEIKRELVSAIRGMRAVNSKLKIILTVSPVPLTATNSDKHVLVATMYSKSVLRAVAGELSDTFPFVDYFPSFEIINSAPFGGVFFEPNKRSVNPKGVSFVMDEFFKAQDLAFGSVEPTSKVNRVEAKKSNINEISDEELVCEEQLLDAFNRT
jgi:hypothetical protein